MSLAFASGAKKRVPPSIEEVDDDGNPKKPKPTEDQEELTVDNLVAAIKREWPNDDVKLVIYNGDDKYEHGWACNHGLEPGKATVGRMMKILKEEVYSHDPYAVGCIELMFDLPICVYYNYVPYVSVPPTGVNEVD
jgi:hypothetical protein